MTIEEHREQEKEGAQKLGKGGDPGDGFGMHRVEGEAKCGPEGEER